MGIEFHKRKDPLKRKMKTYVYLVRHGRTQQNELGILQGAGIDSDLNETGRAQCNQLKGKIPLENSLVFSSPLKRAKQTAEIITDGKCEIIFDQLLKERDFGPLEGNTREDNDNLVAKAGVEKRDQLDGVESIESVNKRIVAFLDKLEGRLMNEQFKSVVIVTHSGIYSKLIRLLKDKKSATHSDTLGINYDFSYFFCENTSVSHIEMVKCDKLSPGDNSGWSPSADGGGPSTAKYRFGYHIKTVANADH